MNNTFMQRIAAFIVEKRNLFFLLAILGFIFSAFSVRWVEVENDLVYYLPDNSETKIGMEIMEDNFVTLGMANVMVANITYEKALDYMEEISRAEGVQSVMFDNTSAHYQNASALYTVSFSYEQFDERCEEALEEVKEILKGQDVYIGSEIGYSLPDIIAGEVEVIMVYVAVIITIVLLLTSQTYAEIPVLLLTFISAAVLNMGTNFIMGKISFVSNSVTTVLQLALSLDYAVIFCNRFKEEHQTLPIKESVIIALSKAIPEILASSMTTIGGLFAMLFMQFKIGPDMGINLIKSIFFALLSVFVIMPGLLVLFGPLMDKTKHKSFIPKISFVGKFAYATRFIIPPVFVAVLIAGCVLSGKCPYEYGYNNLETSKLNEKKIAEHMIRDTFTSTELVALIIPAGDYEAEGAILEELKEYEEINSALGLAGVEALGGYVLSDSLTPRDFAELADLDYELAEAVYMAYAVSAGEYAKVLTGLASYEIPLIDIFLFVCEQADSGIISLSAEQQAMLGAAKGQMEAAKKQLHSEAYSRMLLYVDIPEGGDTLYAFLDTIRETAQKYYPKDEVYVAGNPTSEYDFQKTFVKDNVIISVLTILIVLAVLLFTFKSVGMPLLLIMVIQGSIWINFSVPAVTGNGVFFMTYLIVSAIQMGANIDYAIVIASRFAELKDKMPHKRAIVETMNFAFPTIVISGTIMASASFFIGNMTSEGSIANMGLNLGRGTLISIALVMFVLPQLLLIGARIIDKTSFSIPKVLTAIVGISLTLCCTQVLSVQAADETIIIEDEEDFAAFAENCALDAWSQNKKVILAADLFLGDEEFLPIPTFGGSFDGKGHSISGIKIDSIVSPAGLFGVLQEGAEVKNINVVGNIEPSGILTAAGGIAGENLGSIINCTFTGSIVGERNVGGIAGINGQEGTIQNCRVNGELIGESMTGGICGYNLGSISNCKNTAVVNNISTEPSISLEDIHLDISMDVTGLSNREHINSVADTGGIAGYSMGMIEGCSNSGRIGYPHVGYNVGGIAGRSCGYVTDCENTGEILGRKDIGGVIGQLEPYIHVALSASGAAQIQSKTNALSNAVEHTEGTIGTSSSKLNKRLTRIEQYLGEVEAMLAETKEESLSAADTVRLKVSMSLLEKQLSLLAKETAGSAAALGQDVREVLNSADALTGTFQQVMKEAEEFALSDVVEDISEMNLEEASYGKLTNSRNEGTVYGDLNVGGIAGTVSLEYDVDPEDDLTEDFSIKERRKYELSAIIYESRNEGVVTAKKNYAGGICGRMDLGFITACEAYGTIYSEGGNYVGGIAGLTGSTIEKCYAKCSLAGKAYIGGIVGSGITEDATGESSTVRECYSLVDVTGYQQYVGAIAGIYAGDYIQCQFVSDDLQGINRVSYAGSAEPIAYDDLLKIKGLPKEFQGFSLVFMAENEVVYATAFSYGDSFDQDIFPELPQIKHKNAQWDITELKNLKKDTVVKAVYTDFRTVISSAETREDKRPVFLAEGKYQAEAELFTERMEVTFDLKEERSLPERILGAKVLEQWRVVLPEDGELIHTLRYLPKDPAQEQLVLYVKQEGSWRKIEPNGVGSYLLCNIAGTEAELAVLETNAMPWLLIVMAGLAVGIIGGIIRMIIKKKNVLLWLVWALAVLLLTTVVFLAFVLARGKFFSGVQAYELLQDYAEEPEKAMQLSVDAEIGKEEVTLDATIFCTQAEGIPVTCLEQSGVAMFYADGKLISENGRAYRISQVSADYSELLDKVVFLYQGVDIETVKEQQTKTYRITVKKDSRELLLSYLLPEYAKQNMDVSKMQIDVVESEEALERIEITAKGKFLEDDKKEFDVKASIDMMSVKDAAITIPDVVKEAIRREHGEVQEIITEDVFRMYAAWKKLYNEKTLGMEMYLHADCGPLSVNEELTYITTVKDELRVNCVRKNDYPVYFTQDKICSEKGYAVTTKRAETIKAADLLGIAYELCMNGTYSCTKVGDIYIYSLVLDEAGMKQIAEDIAKASTQFPITFENGSIQIHIQENEVQSIRFACDGNADILLTNIAVAFSAELDLTHQGKYQKFEVPEKVLEALKN